MLNNVTLIGRLTHDPELRHTQSGDAVTNFSIAVDRIGSEKTDFIGINVWRKQAENVCKYLGKGSKVAVTGRLQVDEYNDQEGNRRKSTKVVAMNVVFLDDKNSRDSQGQKSTEEKTEIVDDDLPF